jgi:hypothetical protein
MKTDEVCESAHVCKGNFTVVNFLIPNLNSAFPQNVECLDTTPFFIPENTSVTLTTLNRAARSLGRKVKIELVAT